MKGCWTLISILHKTGVIYFGQVCVWTAPLTLLIYKLCYTKINPGSLTAGTAKNNFKGTIESKDVRTIAECRTNITENNYLV